MVAKGHITNLFCPILSACGCYCWFTWNLLKYIWEIWFYSTWWNCSTQYFYPGQQTWSLMYGMQNKYFTFCCLCYLPKKFLKAKPKPKLAFSYSYLAWSLGTLTRCTVFGNLDKIFVNMLGTVEYHWDGKLLQKQLPWKENIWIGR